MKDLKLSLIIDAFDRATAPLRKIGEAMEGVEKRTEKLHHALHQLGLAEFVGGALFTGIGVEAAKSIWELTDKTAELGEGFLHAAVKAGTTVEEIQRLQYAVKQLGGDDDGLSTVFFRFQTHMANAVQGSKETRGALKELGIPMADLKRLSKDPVEAFMRLVDGFHALQNPTQRAKLAMDLFGRSGVQMMTVLMAGREEIEKFEKQLDDAHAVMSTEDAEAAERFIQNKRQMGLAIQGLEMQIGVRLLPVMTRSIQKIDDWIRKLQPGVVDRFTRAIDGLLDRLPALLPRMERVGEIALKLSDKLLALSDNAGLVKGVLVTLAAFLALQMVVGFVETGIAVTKGVVALAEFAEVLTGLLALSAGVTTFTDAMALLDIALDANPIGVIALAVAALIAVIVGVGVAVYQIYKHWGPIVAWFGGVWDRLKAIFGGGWNALMAIAAPWANVLGLTALAHAIATIHDHWSGVTGWFKALWADIEGVFSAAWKRLTDLTPDWLKTLIKIGAIGVAVSVNPLAGVATAAALTPVAPRAPAPIKPITLAVPAVSIKPVAIRTGAAMAIKPLAATAAPAAIRPGVVSGSDAHGAARGAANHAVHAARARATGHGHPHAKTRVDLHLHVTADGQPKVKKMSASGGADLTVHRGVVAP